MKIALEKTVFMLYSFCCVNSDCCVNSAYVDSVCTDSICIDSIRAYSVDAASGGLDCVCVNNVSGYSTLLIALVLIVSGQTALV